MVLRHAPGNLASKIVLAAVLRDQGALGQARRWYEQVLVQDPQNSYALAGQAGSACMIWAERRQGAQRRFEQGGRMSLARRQPRPTR